MIDKLRKSASERAGLHPDRAPGRHHHPRDPARHRHSVVPRLQGSRQQVGRPGERPRRRPRPRGVRRRQQRVHGRHLAKLQASYDAGIKNVIFGVTAPTATTYCSTRQGRHRRRTTRRACEPAHARTQTARLQVGRRTSFRGARGVVPHPLWGVGVLIGLRARQSSSPEKELRENMMDNLQAASEQRGLHPDRAPGRHHHPRDPARNRDPVVPQLPRPRQQLRRPGKHPRSRPRHRGLQGRQQRLHRHEPVGAPGELDAGITGITVGQPATSTMYCVQSSVSQYTFFWNRAGPADHPGRRQRRGLSVSRERPAHGLTEERGQPRSLLVLQAESAVERPSRSGVPQPITEV